jgi:hypothetical protein
MKLFNIVWLQKIIKVKFTSKFEIDKSIWCLNVIFTEINIYNLRYKNHYIFKKGIGKKKTFYMLKHNIWHMYLKQMLHCKK